MEGSNRFPIESNHLLQEHTAFRFRFLRFQLGCEYEASSTLSPWVSLSEEEQVEACARWEGTTFTGICEFHHSLDASKARYRQIS